MVKITPPVAGRLVHLHRQLGDPVKVGEALITMDSSDISVARADNAKAQSALLLARQEFDRQKLLFDAEIAARKDYEAAQQRWPQPAPMRALRATAWPSLVPMCRPARAAAM
jgi:cobalt-zinc-cadmium efflux system membrane fusion protein